MIHFISGAIAMAYFVSGLFFLRFFKRTGDRLFMWFALAFGILSFQRVAMLYFGESHEQSLAIYGVRLAAFVIILVAIIQKNREK